MNTFIATTQEMKRFVFPLFLSVILFIAGCPHEKYTLKLSMQKDVLHRELAVQGVEKTVPETEIADLEKIYPQKVRRSSAKNHIYTFTGRFTGTTPDDVGGNGSALHYGCSLGSVWAYVETFRGNDDTATEVEKRIKAVNRMVDFLRGWLKYEFGEMDDFAGLDAFLNTTARRDAKSLVLYWWLLQNSENKVHPGRETTAQTNPATVSTQPTTVPASQPTTRPSDEVKNDAQKTIAVRMIQYLFHRQYTDPKDLPNVLQSDPWGFSSASVAVREILLKHILTRKAGLANESKLTAALLKILADEESLKSSVIAYFKTTPEYEKIKRTLKEKTATQPATAPTTQPENPEEEVLSAYMTPIVEKILGDAFDFGSTSDELYITLLLPSDAEILDHNGKHDPENNRVLWAGSIPPRDKKYSVLPGICYAAWSAPDETEQKKRFGKVVLTGDDLAGYIAWFKALPVERQKHWHAALKLVNPMSGADKILSFRFDGDKIPAVRAGHNDL